MINRLEVKNVNAFNTAATITFYTDQTQNTDRKVTKKSGLRKVSSLREIGLKLQQELQDAVLLMDYADYEFGRLASYESNYERWAY